MKTKSHQIIAAPALILIGGGPGVGKSSISAQLMRNIANAVLLDKDRLYSKWVDKLLLAAGQPADRDGFYYWNHVRPLEYASLEHLAFDHLRLGKVVVIDAPLRLELNNSEWMHHLEAACESIGSALIPVWIEISPKCARRRMRQRAEARDRWKLENWDEFIQRQTYAPPCAAELILPNETMKQRELAIAEIMAQVSSR